MKNYVDLTGKSLDAINKFFEDALATKSGVSFKCGDAYYNVIRLVKGDYILSELTLNRSGYVKDATTVNTYDTMDMVSYAVWYIANQ